MTIQSNTTHNKTNIQELEDILFQTSKGTKFIIVKF